MIGRKNTAMSIPIVLAISDTAAQYVLSAIAQCAATTFVLVLTARVLCAQLGKYRLPLSFVLWPSAYEWPIWALFLSSVLVPVFSLTFEWYRGSSLSVALFCVAMVALIPYALYQAFAVSPGSYLRLMHRRRGKGSVGDEEGVFDICGQALKNEDHELLRQSLVVLSQVAPPAQRWSTVYKRVTCLAEKVQDDRNALAALLQALDDFAAPFAKPWLPWLYTSRSRKRSLRRHLRAVIRGEHPKPTTSVLKPNPLFIGDSGLNMVSGTFGALVDGAYRNTDNVRDTIRALATITCDLYLWMQVQDRLSLPRLELRHNLRLLVGQMARFHPAWLSEHLQNFGPRGFGVIGFVKGIPQAYIDAFSIMRLEAEGWSREAWKAFLADLAEQTDKVHSTLAAGADCTPPRLESHNTTHTAA